MSTRLPPPSLLQLFAPPADYVGSFGWVCGYSADASFVDAAAERFTLQTQAQRAATGKMSLLLLLDRGQPQIRPHDAPGALHLPMRDADGFTLLHAKVALLGFSRPEDLQDWCLRLVVSTGNWTRGTLEESLDLAWSVNLQASDLLADDPSSRQARADIHAGWDLMQKLAGSFDSSLLDAVPESLTGIARAQFSHWCDAVRRPRGVKPRFFDSRRASLLAQLPELVRHHAGRVRRNYLIMGSGFFEDSSKPNTVPKALQAIVDSLRGGEEALLSATSAVDLFVEPTACQAVATSLPAILEAQWTVRPAGKPDFLGSRERLLHAKFIFSCYAQERSNSCSSAWIYLGSGNLTTPGFLQACPRGNLEAGVVIADDDLYWLRHRGGDKGLWLEHRLPVQRTQKFTKPAQLAAGAGMPDRPPAFLVPPIAWCRFAPAAGERVARLTLPPHEGTLEILNTAGCSCSWLGADEVAWDEAPQPCVSVQWTAGEEVRQASIPVLDGAGRIGGTELQPLDLEAAWWQLHHFPMPPSEEDANGDAGGSEVNGTGGGGRAIEASDSAIRSMMRLVENLADKQANLREPDWLAWCASLEQTLLQAAQSGPVQAFRELGLNPLSPLRVPCFAPEFARAAEAPARERYLRVLAAVETAWNVAPLSPINE